MKVGQSYETGVYKSNPIKFKDETEPTWNAAWSERELLGPVQKPLDSRDPQNYPGYDTLPFHSGNVLSAPTYDKH